MKKITVTFSRKEQKQICNMAKALGLTRSILVHKALTRYAKDKRGAKGKHKTDLFKEKTLWK